MDAALSGPTPSSLLSLPSFPTLAPKPRPPPPPPTSTLPSSASAHGPVHRRAATGYAAALADAALCAGALGPAARCARRLELRAERPLPDPAAAAAEGGLERHVATMVRLLVGKGRAGMVAEVVAEFVRICDELGATETVVVGESRVEEEEEGEEEDQRGDQDEAEPSLRLSQ
uniref:Uncharacterized protein n=1 Tax=Ananas comosus var. bracteatus TaxID=296719 RepID=A0A6V7PHK9_ANACO|nr:unnamed protein product [Ananas comosus var. bracteatus]